MHLFEHQGLRKYAQNTLWLLVENILRLVSGVLVGVWVTRYLGPEKYGILSYALASVAIFGTIAKVGLDSIVIRDLVNYPSKLAEYLGTSFWLKIIGGITTLLLVWITTSNFYVVIIAAGLIFQSFEVIDFYFQSQVKSKFVSIGKVAQVVISSLLKVYLIKVHADLSMFALVYLIDQISLAMFLYITYRHEKRIAFLNKFNMKIAKELVSESWPVIAISLAAVLQSRADQILINTKIGPLELGYYAAAIGFIEIFSFVPIIINSSFTPAIMNAKKRSEAEYFYRLQKYYSLMFVLFLVVALPIFIFGKQLVILLYGIDFSRAGFIFSLMALRVFFTNMGVARSQFILNEKLYHYNFIATLIGAIVSIILNYLLVPYYGLVGAIIISYLSYFISTFFIDIFTEKTRYNLWLMLKGILTAYKVLAI